jgi:hypothetical protein
MVSSFHVWKDFTMSFNFENIAGDTAQSFSDSAAPSEALTQLVQWSIKAILMAVFIVVPPAATLIYMRWDDIRPYYIGDAETAEGTLYYFTGVG